MGNIDRERGEGPFTAVFPVPRRKIDHKTHAHYAKREYFRRKDEDHGYVARPLNRSWSGLVEIGTVLVFAVRVSSIPGIRPVIPLFVLICGWHFDLRIILGKWINVRLSPQLSALLDVLPPPDYYSSAFDLWPHSQTGAKTSGRSEAVLIGGSNHMHCCHCSFIRFSDSDQESKVQRPPPVSMTLDSIWEVQSAFLGGRQRRRWERRQFSCFFSGQQRLYPRSPPGPPGRVWDFRRRPEKWTNISRDQITFFAFAFFLLPSEWKHWSGLVLSILRRFQIYPFL